ncbi:Uncharacterised protein [Bordetella pertussis]|nr:Uncharacterised protein [Bordetella pertussis]CFW32543.1 Uncharacterised protein [Bordetella pertussis]
MPGISTATSRISANMNSGTARRCHTRIGTLSTTAAASRPAVRNSPWRITK